MTTYADVKKQIAQLEKKAADLRKVEVAKVVANIREQMAKYELTVDDIAPGKQPNVESLRRAPRRQRLKARQIHGPQDRQDLDRPWESPWLDSSGNQSRTA